MSPSPSYLDDQRPGATPAKNDDRPGISSLTLIVITIVVIGIVYGLCMLLVSTVVRGAKDHTIAMEKRILYAVDTTALITACRQLAVNGNRQIDPASPSVPGVIHRVDPNTITITDDHVVLECGNSKHHFGVAAYVGTNSPTTQPTPSMAVRELAPGLWYYSDDGVAPAP